MNPADITQCKNTKNYKKNIRGNKRNSKNIRRNKRSYWSHYKTGVKMQVFRTGWGVQVCVALALTCLSVPVSPQPAAAAGMAFNTCMSACGISN